MGDESDTSAQAGARWDGPTLLGQTQVQEGRFPLSGSLLAAPPVGTLIGKYVVERTIGTGGMGIVVAARHQQLGELVAIKLLHPKAAEDKIHVERFVREARATARIKSEHVVRVLDAGADELTGAPYIVMEHLEGNDLGKILKLHGPMPVAMAVDIMLQVCEAVAAAHALGIIHRDLKPSNFFVTSRADGTSLVKVLDFGISKAVDLVDGAADPKLTETQAVFGSPTYMSPEQIRSSKNVDPRSDIWSLGVGLFEMLTGKMPFVADNVSGLLASIVADAPFRPTLFAAAVPPDLEAVVLGCMEKDPARRIPSTAELARHLAPFASAEGALLAARIERIATGSGKSLPPPALQSGSYPSMPPLPMSRPSLPPAFGNTGDMSATGPAQFRARRGSTLLTIVATALVLVGGTLGVYFARARFFPAAAPASASAQLTAPSAPIAEPPPVVAPPAVSVAAPALTTDASPVASATTRHRGGRPPPRAGTAAGATQHTASPAPPTPKANATDDRL